MNEDSGCDHKFVDSKVCLKCGWQPENSSLDDHRTPAALSLAPYPSVPNGTGDSGHLSLDPNLLASENKVLSDDLEAERERYAELQEEMAELKQEHEARLEVMQAMLDAATGKLDTSTQVSDHPNVKCVLIQVGKKDYDLQRLRDGLATLEQEIRRYGDKSVWIPSASIRWSDRLRSLLSLINGGSNA